jgi:hypothetical protein
MPWVSFYVLALVSNLHIELYHWRTWLMPVSALVLCGMFKVNISLTRHLKSSPFVCVLLKSGSFSWFSTSTVSVIKIRERLEDRSKHDFAPAKYWGMPFVDLVVYSCHRCFRLCLPSFWVVLILWMKSVSIAIQCAQHYSPPPAMIHHPRVL